MTVEVFCQVNVGVGVCARPSWSPSTVGGTTVEGFVTVNVGVGVGVCVPVLVAVTVGGTTVGVLLYRVNVGVNVCVPVQVAVKSASRTVGVFVTVNVGVKVRAPVGRRHSRGHDRRGVRHGKCRRERLRAVLVAVKSAERLLGSSSR